MPAGYAAFLLRQDTAAWPGRQQQQKDQDAEYHSSHLSFCK